MQIISNDKIVRSDSVQDVKEFNAQTLSTQVKKGEQLVSVMPADSKAFDLMGDDIVELHRKNETLKKQIGDYDQKSLEEPRTKFLKQIDDEKRASLMKSRLKKQMNKH